MSETKGYFESVDLKNNEEKGRKRKNMDKKMQREKSFEQTKRKENPSNDTLNLLNAS